MSKTLKQVVWSVASIIIMSFFFGWKLSLLIAATIGWHEYSHILGAKLMKLKTAGFLLIPMVGGVSFIADQYKTRSQTAFVALAGPMGGTVQGLLVLLLYVITGLPFFAAAAYFILFIQLFNLIPITTILDGGQLVGTITYSINRSLGVIYATVSTLLALLFFVYIGNPILGALIGFFGGLSVFREVQNWLAWHKGHYWLLTSDWLDPPQKLTLVQACLTSFSWVSTMIVCAVGMHWLSTTALHYATLSYLFHK